MTCEARYLGALAQATAKCLMTGSSAAIFLSGRGQLGGRMSLELDTRTYFAKIPQCHRRGNSNTQRFAISSEALSNDAHDARFHEGATVIVSMGLSQESTRNSRR